VISACEIGDSIDIVIDDRESIQGYLMPGTDRPILPLKDAIPKCGSRLVCLLGVGAENEFKVRRRLTDAHQGSVVFISLFSPRDTLASIVDAQEALGDMRSMEKA
jgi:hypothetical protein